jgi:hypothetical protein
VPLMISLRPGTDGGVARERSEAERNGAAEPADDAYRFPRNRRAEPVGKAVLRPFSGPRR